MMIHVTPEQLVALSSQLRAGASSIDAQTTSMASSLAPLQGGDWAGQASEQFRLLWEQWHDSARRLREALEGISTVMSSAAHAYEQAEQGVAATFRS